MAKNTIIIGDVHGNLDALINTLMAAGAIRRDGSKNDDWRVISVGDMCNMAPYGVSFRGFVSQDLETLEYAMTVVDDMVIGNHELHFISGAFDSTVGYWDGMAAFDQLQNGMVSAITRACLQGLYVAAVEVDGMLVTHAGLHPQFIQDDLGIHYPDDPADVAQKLNDDFVLRATHERRLIPALDSLDGIFWNRPEPWGLWDKGTPYVQVCGHTPLSGEHPKFYDSLNAWIIDTGNYMDMFFSTVGALVKREGETEYSTFNVNRTVEIF